MSFDVSILIKSLNYIIKGVNLMLKSFLMTLLASIFVMRWNLNWHRQLIMIAIPLYIIFMIVQSEYIVSRIKHSQELT